jgi:hypothetical protein
MPRATCPKCGAVLQLTDDMVNQQIECGSCQAIIVAKPETPTSRRSADPQDRPSRRPRDEEPEVRPSRRRSRRDGDDEDDHPSGRGRTGDDYEVEDDYPPKPKSSLLGLGIASLILGIISLLIEIPSFIMSLMGAACCCLAPLALASWLGHAIGGVFAAVGLGLGIFGLRDSKGRGMATAGTIMCSLTFLGALVGVLLSILGIAVQFPVAPPPNQQLKNQPFGPQNNPPFGPPPKNKPFGR